MRIPRRPSWARFGVTQIMRSITGCTPTFQQATERIRSDGREASGERVCASECVHACVRVRVCLPTSRPFCPSASLSACPSFRPSVDVFACLSACAPVPLSLCVSVDLSVGVLVQCLCVCRCVHLPVCLSIFACGRARACLRPCVCASLFAQVRACASACVCACVCVPRARVCVGLARHSPVLPSSALGSPLPHLHRI